MSRQSWPVLTALACAAGLAWLLAGNPAEAPAKDGKDKPAAKEAPGKDIFGLSTVHEFHLEVSAKEYEKMPPADGMRFPGGPGGPGGPAKPAEKPAEKPTDVHKGSGFGMEFPIVPAEFTAEGRTIKNVGLRYKGNASYMASARGAKRNFKVELDHYDAELRFHGQKKINLNAGAMDPTKGREALSYAIYRAAGVPAPRTAFAEVTLTVPGKYDKEYLGLYTVVEQVDKVFLKDRFKNGNGLLMKPEGVRGLEYLGDDWDKYKPRYKPKHDPSKKEAQRVIEFAKLVNRADDEQFHKEVGSYLDVDEFLRFLAATAMVANMDSVFSLGHNYYIYLNPETNKFVFIPWDLDLSLVGFPMMGSPDQLMDLSVTHPYSGQNKLVDRLLAVKEVNEQYQKLVKELATTCFTKEKLLKDVEEIEKVTKEPLAKEKKAAEARKEGAGGFGFGPPGGGFGQPASLRTFVEKRTELVLAQVDGKSKGYVPAFGFGPAARPGGFGMGNFWAKPLLEALDTDKDGKVSKDELVAGVKKFFAEADKDKKGKLDEKQLAAGLNRVFPQPQGFGPPPGPPGGGPGGPGGFGPGNMVAGAIVKRADADKDGTVTLDELVAAAEALFKEADKDKKGKLDEAALAAGINLLFPAPQGFGPGGFGGPPQPGQLMPPFFQEVLKLTAEQKKQLEELQKEVDAKLGKILTDEQKKQLKEMQQGPGRGGPGGFGPGGGPPGFGPPPGEKPPEPKKDDKKEEKRP